MFMQASCAAAAFSGSSRVGFKLRSTSGHSAGIAMLTMMGRTYPSVLFPECHRECAFQGGAEFGGEVDLLGCSRGGTRACSGGQAVEVQENTGDG